jgi:hypothetical protein
VTLFRFYRVPVPLYAISCGPDRCPQAQLATKQSERNKHGTEETHVRGHTGFRLAGLLACAGYGGVDPLWRLQSLIPLTSLPQAGLGKLLIYLLVEIPFRGNVGPGAKPHKFPNCQHRFWYSFDRSSNQRRFAMKKLFLLIASATLLMPGLAVAQSAFDGTWKIDMSTVDFSKKPDVFLLQNGMYECKTCAPPYDVKADGADQSVSGHPYYDTVAIKVVSDHEIEETDKKDGKVVATSTTTVAPDGNTITFTFSDSSATNGGPPVTGKGEATRVAKGPAGSNAISGSWRTTKMEGLSDNATVFTYKISGDEITMTNPTGQSYTAKLNGTEAPMKGDPGVSSVSVRMRGKDTLEETDKRDGKVIGVFKMTVAADAKTAKASYDSKLENRVTDFPNVTKQ